MPAKVSENIRATVTAGLAKLVELVNQYAAVIQPATAYATWSARPARSMPNTTTTRPRVATTSPSQRPAPLRSWVGDRHGVEVEHEVGDDHADEPADDLGGGEDGGGRGVDQAEQPLGQRDHRVERRRDRLQGEDQRDQYGAGGEAVGEQLDADVVGQPGGHDPGADHGRDEERRTRQLGDGAAEHQGHPATPPSRVVRAPRASRSTR